MKFLLDTNICIHYLRGGDTVLGDRLRAGQGLEICLCSPVVSELLIGAKKSQYRDKHLPVTEEFINRFDILPFDEKAARVHVDIYLEMSSEGRTIQPFDLQIAAIAISNHLVVVTHNTQHFSNIPNLPIEDWQR